MEEKILKLFKKRPGNYLSGEQISRELNITRSAFWKHIEKLRGLGYEFDAVPHFGYRLRKAPDKLYPFEILPALKTNIIGRRIEYYDTLSSTNTAGYDIAKQGAKEGTVVIAEKQTRGKGRLSREWISPKGKGAYLSIVLRPEITPYEAPLITLMAAVSTAQAIRAKTDAQALIKWPNDIIINGKKAAGILTEMEAEPDSAKFLVVGIGINVTAKEHDLPKGATSISLETEYPVSRPVLVRTLLESFEKNYILFKNKGFSLIRREWLNLSLTLGRRVKVISMHRRIEGEATDIDSDGALKIRLDNGFQEKVMAGDLVLLR